METENGIVTKIINSQMAIVKTVRNTSCDSCCSKDSCHSMGGGKELETEAINLINAKIGDNVIIGFETSAFIRISLLVYILPVACMIIGAILGDKIALNYALSSPIMSVGLSFGLLALSFMLIKLVGKIISSKEKYKPKIIKILIPIP